MGRQAKWPEGGETMAFYMSKGLAGFVKRAARNEGISKSEVVRRALSKYFHLPLDATQNHDQPTGSSKN